jgi:hypothetical protein
MLNEEEVGLASFSFKVLKFGIIIDESLIDKGDMSNSSVVSILESISDGFDSGTLFGFFT